MFRDRKPYSAVTVAIENLTSEDYLEDDLSGIPDLVEAIKLQATGPTEAARAIRKKLKYGNVHRQLRALTILDGLIQNAGHRFQRTFADEPLLERLRVCATSELSDVKVRNKCRVLFAQWAVAYKKTPGLERICALHKQQPRRKEPVTQAQSRVLRETERDPFEEADESPERPAPSHASSSRTSAPLAAAGPSIPKREVPKPKDKKDKHDKNKTNKKRKPFVLAEEKEKMKVTIAESSVSSTNLLNALKLINREKERVSENELALKHFETCKLLRRHVLRYIQHVNSEEWLGPLISANDNLVQALMTFEQLDRSMDADSDSDDELAEQAHAYRMATERAQAQNAADQLAGLNLGPANPDKAPAMPPRPPAPAEEEEEEEEEEDENDPFADRNAIATPAVERSEPTWKVV